MILVLWVVTLSGKVHALREFQRSGLLIAKYGAGLGNTEYVVLFCKSRSQ